MIKLHTLKSTPDNFQPICAGRRWDIRRDDRGFEKDDILHLREWSPVAGYSGNEIVCIVLSVVKDPGLEPSHVVLSFGQPHPHVNREIASLTAPGPTLGPPVPTARLQ